jgi:hypothetical protein
MCRQDHVSALPNRRTGIRYPEEGTLADVRDVLQAFRTALRLQVLNASRLSHVRSRL